MAGNTLPYQYPNVSIYATFDPYFVTLDSTSKELIWLITEFSAKTPTNLCKLESLTSICSFHIQSLAMQYRNYLLYSSKRLYIYCTVYISMWKLHLYNAKVHCIVLYIFIDRGRELSVKDSVIYIFRESS
jgi:hypothetical protein